MRRREAIAALGAAALWPAIARSQQAGAMPVIGFLHSGSAEANAKRVAGFRQGLADSGFVEGRNVAIEFRWANGQDAKLPELAADLIARKVAVIATLSSTVAAVAAKKATSTIPIYFLIAESPDRIGLVQTLNRPGGNATGIVTLAHELASKRYSLLHEMMPQAPAIAALIRPLHPSAADVRESVQATSKKLNVRLDLYEANTEPEIEKAYAALKPGTPLMVATDPYFFSRRAQLVALSAKQQVPTIYDSREFAEAGGLLSYGPSHVRLWQQAGTYVARIIRGQKPADLPVTQAAIFDFVINQKTAKTLGLNIPSTLVARADEVIG